MISVDIEVFQVTLKPANNETQLTVSSVTANKENMFRSNCFLPLAKGIFWFHVSFNEGNVYGFVNVSLSNRKKTLRTDWSHSVIPASSQVTTFVDLQLIQYDEAICTTVNDVTSASIIHQASFTGFRLDERAMALFVALKSETKYHNGSIIFARNHLVVNWRITGGYEVIEVPVSGVYLIAVNAFIVGYSATDQKSKDPESTAFRTHCINVLLNKAHMPRGTLTVMILEGIAPTSSWETILLNGITLYQMEAGDKLIMDVTTLGFSRLMYQLVLYEPLHNSRIAWSVYKYFGKRNFDVLVNEGQAWSSAKSSVRTTIAGMYYVALTVMPKFTLNQKVVCVTLNNDEAIFATEIRPEKTGWVNSTRTAALIQLGLGDVLFLQFKPVNNTEIHASAYFIGFLVQPI